jgi:hypothetical protein
MHDDDDDDSDDGRRLPPFVGWPRRGGRAERFKRN